MASFNFIGGGNQSTWRKSVACHKSLTNFITLCCMTKTFMLLKKKNSLLFVF